jgi:hypothetical protein
MRGEGIYPAGDGATPVPEAAVEAEEGDDSRFDRRITLYLPARLKAQYLEEARRRHIRLGRVVREKLLGEGELVRRLAQSAEGRAQDKELIGHLKALVSAQDQELRIYRLRGPP